MGRKYVCSHFSAAKDRDDQPGSVNLAPDQLAAVTERVQRWLLHPLSIRRLMDWPCLADLFRADLRERIQALVAGDHTEFARPLRFELTNKRYFYPGSSTDLITFTDGVVGCLPAISRALGPAVDDLDLTPPLAADLSRGECGAIGVMALHWNRLVATVGQQQFEGGVVVHADIRRCFGSLGRERLVKLLDDAGADERSIARINGLMEHWQRHGCPGVPMALVSWPLVKLYLQRVDQQLRDSGIRALRLGDDYRLLCRSGSEAERALEVLEKILAGVGLGMSKEKSWFEHSGDGGDALKRRQRIWHGRLKGGVLRPLLSESLRFPIVRPVALPLLRWLASRCEVMGPET